MPRNADAIPFYRVVLLLCLVFLAVLLRTAWLGDDALITFRTVMNVTHGYGLTFNIAERVQSYTHPLWLLLLTGAYLIVGNVYYAAFLVSIGVSLAVFWLALSKAATRMQVWIVVAVLLCSRAFVDYSTSGLENPLSNLLLACCRPRFPRCTPHSVRESTRPRKPSMDRPRDQPPPPRDTEASRERRGHLLTVFAPWPPLDYSSNSGATSVSSAGSSSDSSSASVPSTT